MLLKRSRRLAIAVIGFHLGVALLASPGSATEVSDEWVRGRAEAVAEMPEGQDELNRLVAAGRFGEASEMVETWVDARRDVADASSAALLRDVQTLLGYWLILERFEQADRYADELHQLLSDRGVPAERLRFLKRTGEAAKHLLRRKDPPAIAKRARYVAVLRSVSVLEAKQALAESTEAAAADDDMATRNQVEWIAEQSQLEADLFGESHPFRIHSLFSLAMAHIAEGQTELAGRLADELRRIAGDDAFPALAGGHAHYLDASAIAAGENSADPEARNSTVDSFVKSAEAYGKVWPVDAAYSWYAAGDIRHVAEDYTAAIPLQAAAFEAFQQTEMFRDALNQGFWLLEAYRMAERHDQAWGALDRAVLLAQTLGPPADLGSLMIDKAWIAEAEGDNRLMRQAYEQSVEAYVRAEDVPEAIETCRRMVVSHLANVDNEAARLSYDWIVQLALREGMHRVAADAAVDASARVRRMADRESQLKTLQAYRLRMSDPAAMKILIDEVARVKAGMSESFTLMRREARQLAERIAGGEEIEDVPAELDAVETVDEEQSKTEAEAFLEIARDHERYQRAGFAAVDYLNAALWWNDCEDTGEQISFAMRRRGDALMESHHFSQAALAYQIAGDHASPNSETAWECLFRRSLAHLAAHQLQRAGEGADPLATSSVQRGPEGRDRSQSECQAIRQSWLSADILWQRGELVRAEQAYLSSLPDLVRWIGETDQSMAGNSAADDSAADDSDESPDRCAAIAEEYRWVRQILLTDPTGEETLAGQYPARLVTLAVREGLAKDPETAAAMLTMVVDGHPDTPVARAALNCRRLLEGLKQPQRADVAGDNALSAMVQKAGRLYGQRKFEPSIDPAKAVVERLDRLPREERPAQLAMQMHLLISEAIVRSDSGWFTGVGSSEAVEHLNKAESYLDATGLRPQDKARCAAVRYLLENEEPVTSTSIHESALLLDWIADYVQTLRPKRAEPLTLAVQPGELFRDIMFDSKFRGRADVNQAQRASWLDASVQWWFWPACERDGGGRPSVVALTSFTIPNESVQISRAICYAVLDLVAGGRRSDRLVGRYDIEGQEVVIDIDLDSLEGLLAEDGRWLAAIADRIAPPDAALVWWVDDAAAGTDPGMVALHRLFKGPDGLFAVPSGQVNWASLRETIEQHLSNDLQHELLSRAIDAMVVIPADEGSSSDRVRFSRFGVDRIRRLVAEQFGLPEPESGHQPSPAWRFWPDVLQELSSGIR